jgi:hypothetical protein
MSRTKKTNVRSDFSYARLLMRKAEKMMRVGITDFDQSGEAGQIALELIASVGTFGQWLEEQGGKGW